MRVINCEQYSTEWWEARRGIPTASAFDRIITAKTGKLSAGALGYAFELVADLAQLGPEPWLNEPGYESAAMKRGTQTEHEARRFYEMERDVDVQRVGFCITDAGDAGCSPDGLVGESGGLELKCPLLKTHVGYLYRGGLPDEYKPQVHGSLIVTGREWWDFLSYAPGLPPLLVRVEPDDYTESLRHCLAEFQQILAEVKAKVPVAVDEVIELPEEEPLMW